jgi:thioredoxin:protein disulfide reductase
MKFFSIILILCSFIYAQKQEFIEPDIAFQTKAQKINNKIHINLKLYENIYTYHSTIKLFINKPKEIDITNEISKPKGKIYDKELVLFDNILLEVEIQKIIKYTKQSNFELRLDFQGCSTKGICYAPISRYFQFNLTQKELSLLNKSSILNNKQKTNDKSETGLISSALKNSSFLYSILIFFGFGILLSLTPCILPMVPILSTIIINANKKTTLSTYKNFIICLSYILSMSLSYAILGILTALFGSNLQSSLQNPIVLYTISSIFVFLSFSMFGYIKLQMPQFIQTKINNLTIGKEKKGILGVIIIGFLSSFIIGPCVSPALAGALIYISQTGDTLLGAFALFSLSFGMGIPLLLIGLGAGRFIPKQGPWMNNISKIIGILLLIIAIWLVEPIIKKNIMIYIYALLFLFLALYTGIFSFLRQNISIYIKIKNISSIIFFTLFIIYTLGALSGTNNSFSPLEKLYNNDTPIKELNFKKIKTIKELEIFIKNSQKPIMLDFYASWCISCKELENITFKDIKVYKKLSTFNLLKVDITNNTKEDKKLLNKFNLFGPPALIFWDKNGNNIKQATIIGFKNGQDFLKHINKYFKN